MPKGMPNLAIGYGPKPGVLSAQGAPIDKVGSAGNSLVRDIRKGWNK